jgi:hypothetical protein
MGAQIAGEMPAQQKSLNRRGITFGNSGLVSVTAFQKKGVSAKTEAP